jgi:hypothetical protein
MADVDFADDTSNTGSEADLRSPVLKRKPAGSTDGPERKKKEELKWYPALDKILLTDCLEKEVWTATRNTRVQMFTAVANSLRQFDPAKFRLATGRNCTARYNLLLETFVSDNFAKLNTSGTIEEYEEREQILQQIKEQHDLFKEELTKSNIDKGKVDNDLIAHGKLLREASMARMQVQQPPVAKQSENALMMMASAFKDMIEMSKPPSASTNPPQNNPKPSLTFAEAQIVNIWDYMVFAGIPQRWHQDYLPLLENCGFDTPDSLFLATGQQLVQAGIKIGHVNLLLNAKSKLHL